MGGAGTSADLSLGEWLPDSEPRFTICKLGHSLPAFHLHSISGTGRLPDEPDGRPPAQFGHKYLGTDHLPAGHFPGLGPQPLSQCHSTVIHFGQRHVADPLSPPWRLSLGGDPPGRLVPPPAAGIIQDDQALRCNQCAANKGDL